MGTSFDLDFSVVSASSDLARRYNRADHRGLHKRHPWMNHNEIWGGAVPAGFSQCQLPRTKAV